MKIKTIALALLIASGAHAASAASTQEIVSGLMGQGYSDIEVKRSGGKIKIEGRRGRTEVEVVIDAKTGEVISSEIEKDDEEERRRERGDKDRRDGHDDDRDDDDDNDEDDDEGDDDESDDDDQDDDGDDD